MSTQSGNLNGSPLVQVNRIVSDGVGNITGTGTAGVNGVVTNPVITATYTVDSDCNGTLNSVPGGLIPKLRREGEWLPGLLHRDGAPGRVRRRSPEKRSGFRREPTNTGVGCEAGLKRGPLSSLPPLIHEDNQSTSKTTFPVLDATKSTNNKTHKKMNKRTNALLGTIIATLMSTELSFAVAC